MRTGDTSLRKENLSEFVRAVFPSERRARPLVLSLPALPIVYIPSEIQPYLHTVGFQQTGRMADVLAVDRTADGGRPE
jgi:hypothetical protein